MAKRNTQINGGVIRITTDDTKMQGPDKGERIIFKQEIIEKSSKPGTHEHTFYEVRVSPGGTIKVIEGSVLRPDRPRKK